MSILPPPLRLSTIIGDVVVNTRAALDYIICELAQRYFVPPFDPQHTLDRHLHPIAVDEQNLPNGVSMIRLL